MFFLMAVDLAIVFYYGFKANYLIYKKYRLILEQRIKVKKYTEKVRIN